MRIVIAGSRTLTDVKAVESSIEAVLNITKWDCTCLIAGGADGVDSIATDWARKNKMMFRIMPANWKKYGRAAGPIRNCDMAKDGDALIAIWDGKSRGTAHMIGEMEKLMKPRRVVINYKVPPF